MSEEKQRTFDRWAEGFLLPLLTGETAQLQRFLPPGYLSHFSFATPTESTVHQDLLEAFTRRAGEIVRNTPLTFPEVGAAATAMALHNLAALTDPLLDRAFARGSRPRVLEWIDSLIAAIDVPRTRGEALTRHVLIAQTLGGARKDTVVKNWAYTYRFFGRRPPANVVALPRLRFVRQEHSERPMRDLLEEHALDLEDRIAALVARSPITHLLEHTSGTFRFGAADLAVLSDEALRYGIVQQIVRSSTAGSAAAFGDALRELARDGTPPEFLAVAIAFIGELQVLEVLDERRGNKPLDVPGVGNEELFAAMLPALIEDADAGGALGARIALHARDMMALRARASLRATQAGEDAVEAARQLCKRASDLSAKADGSEGLGW